MTPEKADINPLPGHVYVTEGDIQVGDLLHNREFQTWVPITPSVRDILKEIGVLGLSQYKTVVIRKLPTKSRTVRIRPFYYRIGNVVDLWTSDMKLAQSQEQIEREEFFGGWLHDEIAVEVPVERSMRERGYV